VSDTSKFTATFGPFAATPHTAAIAATLDWYRANPARGVQIREKSR
jgi:hypothetical protein